MSPRTVYLAGPEVFLPDAMATGNAKKQLCERYGLRGLFPLDAAIVADSAGDLSRRIFTANMALIASAHCGIFNLTPFRGPSADVGTVFELGVFIGQGKPVFAYTNAADDFLARVAVSTSLSIDGTAWRDGAGMSVENFGNADNLMIDEALAGQGRVLHRMTVAPDERFRSLLGFQICVREAVSSFSAM